MNTILPSVPSPTPATAVPSSVTPTLTDITTEKAAIEQRLQELAALERQAIEDAQKAKRDLVLSLPQHLGLQTLGEVLHLIHVTLGKQGAVKRYGSGRTAKAAVKAASSTKRRVNGPIPEDIKEAIDLALGKGGSVPSLAKAFHVSTAWLSNRKQRLGLVGKKGRVPYAQLVNEGKIPAFAQAA